MDMPRTGPGFELVSFLHPNNPVGTDVVPGPVINSDLHLIHTVAGRAEIRVGSELIQMNSNSVIFVPPETEYCVTLQPRQPLVMLNFHFHLFGHEGETILLNRILPCSFRPPGMTGILQMLSKLHRIWAQAPRSATQGSRVVARLHLLAALYFQKFSVSAPPGCRDSEMLQLQKTLNDSALHDFDAEALAAKLFMSVSQMNRRFRAAYGLSPKSFWQRQRNLRARHALRYSSLSVSELAAQLGYADASYFNRWFVKMNGSPPGKFRTQGGAREF
jgi:AraC-like DNA-binding protein